MSDDDELVGGDDWGLDQLGGNHDDLRGPPNLLELIHMFHSKWISTDDYTVSNITEKLMHILDIQQFTWDEFERKHEIEKRKFVDLHKFVSMQALDGEPLKDMFELANVIFGVRDLMKQSARMVANLNPSSDLVRRSLPPDTSLEDENENVFEHREKDNTAWQNLFFHVRLALEGYSYRKAEDKFFSRLILGNGIETIAFKEKIKILDFVYQQCDPYSNYKAFKWSTAVPSNAKILASHIEERPLIEAPLLNENNHLRSYGRISDGKGNCGIYNHFCDMFFHYNERDEWSMQASLVQTVRRLMGDEYYCCTPPENYDTAVIHIDATFPHNIYDEVKQLTKPRGSHWMSVHKLPDDGAQPLISHLKSFFSDVLLQRGCCVLDLKVIHELFKKGQEEDPAVLKGCLIGDPQRGWYVEQGSLENTYEFKKVRYVDDKGDIPDELYSGLALGEMDFDAFIGMEAFEDCVVQVGEYFFIEQVELCLYTKWVEVEEYECR